jgi:thiol-disulfide isomerase/thioredoxin
MKVKRISSKTLNDILDGNTFQAETCLIKVYGNECNYCHNLKEYYEEVAKEYEGVHFFAFNIADDMKLEKRLGFRGIPTIIKVRTQPPDAQINILGEPEDPNKLTWYRTSDIKHFIEETNHE